MGPLSMEQLSVNQGNGQSAGYILYETVITGGGVLNSGGHVKDRGQVRGGDGQRVPFSAGETLPMWLNVWTAGQPLPDLWKATLVSYLWSLR